LLAVVRGELVIDPEDKNAYDKPKNDSGFRDLKDAKPGRAHGDDLVIVVEFGEGINRSQQTGKRRDLDEYRRKKGKIVKFYDLQAYFMLQDHV